MVEDVPSGDRAAGLVDPERHSDELPTAELRIAVTGHRDLSAADPQVLRRSVRSALASIVDHARPARVVLLCGMADGADQLVADEASKVGCALHLVLPKPASEYAHEISSAGSNVLGDAIRVGDPPVSTISSSGDQSSSDEAAPYDRLGRYLARRAHLLVAMWDGSAERKPGGTFDVLVRYLDGDDTGPQPVHPEWVDSADLEPPRSGPTALWVETPRSRSASSSSEQRASAVPAASDDGVRYLSPSGTPGMWSVAASPPPALVGLLQDASSHAAALATASAAGDLGDGYPLLDTFPDNLDGPTREALEETHAAYLDADGLAMRNQTRSDRSFLFAALVAAAMGFAFLWFAKINSAVFWLWLYVALFVAGYGLFRWARSRNWLRHHLSQRVMAETLRTRFFSMLLGVTDRVDIRGLMDLTGVSSFPGFAWAAEADRIGVPTAVSAGSRTEADFVVDERMSVARDEWVEDQARYFERKVEGLEAREERLEVIARVLYVLTFVATVALIFFGASLKKEYLTDDVNMKTALVFLMGLLPLWIGLWEIHEGRMATRERLWQFRNQASLFARASARLNHLDAPPVMLDVFVGLAERSLFETYLWTIHRFHREFEPPSAG